MKVLETNYADFEVRPDIDKKCLTIKELRDFLSELVEGGFGGYSVSASTQDGASYDITGSMLVHGNAKEFEFN